MRGGVRLSTFRITLRALIAAGVVATALTLGGAPAAAGTLEFDRLFPGHWQVSTCTQGATISNCFIVEAKAVVRGLGRVTMTEQVIQSGAMDADFCEAQIRLGKLTTARGTIDYFADGIDCPGTRELTGGYRGVVVVWRVVGGTGAYAGATGGGDATVRPEEGEVFIHFHGSLDVPALRFDTTAPLLASVPRSLTVNAGSSAVVRYRTPTAVDAVDGAVPVACSPGSGTRFKPGRTKVRCEAVDSSGNAAVATFVVHVRRGGR